MHILGEHALVIGGSVAGLMTARVLARHYARVTVIDRDVLPADSRHRKGVPHGLHAHGLLARGRELLESYFPGLTEDLAAQGALKGDLLADCVWFNHGVYLKQEWSGLTGLLVSRPLLENYVRQRVAALRNVRLLEGCEALNPMFDPGYRAHSRGSRSIGTGAVLLDADLVVDAAGRGLARPDWLQALGHEVPSGEKVEVGIGYTTRPTAAARARRRQLAVVVRGGAPDYRSARARAGGRQLDRQHRRLLRRCGARATRRACARSCGPCRRANSARSSAAPSRSRASAPIASPRACAAAMSGWPGSPPATC